MGNLGIDESGEKLENREEGRGKREEGRGKREGEMAEGFEKLKVRKKL